MPWHNSCHVGRHPNPSLSSWWEASCKSAIYPSWGSSWVMATSTKSATGGLRALIMGNASAHDAQHAAFERILMRTSSPNHLCASASLPPVAHWRALGNCGDTGDSRPHSMCLRRALQHTLKTGWEATCGGCGFLSGCRSWSNSTQAHCKSGTAGIVSHNLRSSSILRFILSCAICSTLWSSLGAAESWCA